MGQAEQLGDLEARRALSKSIQEGGSARPCLAAWHDRPKGLDELQLDLELRVRGEAGGYVVEDAKVANANLSDDELERCILGRFRGLRIQREDANPSARVRLPWSIRLGLL